MSMVLCKGVQVGKLHAIPKQAEAAHVCVSGDFAVIDWVLPSHTVTVYNRGYS